MLYYSKVKKNKLIYSHFKLSDFKNSREDFSPDNQYLQASCSNLSKDRVVKSHKHKLNKRLINITQEAWLVFKGAISAKFYDIDDSFISEIILKKGDCVILYNGGHDFKSLKKDTILYEFKNGPYYGPKKDRINIDK
tara:strand:- start:579 stop:989 length:411 start_codon:yes stop_codon:yes gene_type:complete